MKLLHTSDLHLNSKMDSRLSKDKARERKRELMINFRKMTEAAKREGCSGFIIAGDLFDSDRPTESAKKTVLDIIAADDELIFFYLPGNHEKDAIATSDALPKNLKLFGESWTGFAFGDVYIAGRSETAPDMFDELRLPEGAPVIAVLHGELRDKSDFGGAIGRRELYGSGISYLALGHYHGYRAKRIGSTEAVYSGTPEGRGFDETGETGYVIIDTAGGELKYSFRAGFGRRLHIRNIELDGTEGSYELEEKILHATRDIPPSDLVRALLVGKRLPETRFDTGLIEKRLSDKFYYFEIKDEARLSVCAEDYATDKSLKGEFIRLVLSDGTLSERERNEIISCGLSALMGEKFEG